MKITGSINEAVEATGLSRSTLYRAISAGNLKTVRVGHRTLVRWDSLLSMLEAA
ncbi:helix-turn-helix domain-containing protein [Sphingomonas sp. KR1UV-12]|uniref:Helix-turn-helix domain-containing protein n=1 Tax=Sphingomonas aurea TaxID=3063994 RepID=A0ABT9EH61_9SPHN|nr:helix-turn-helix domain-containing protein [Sphingomonas sp. KR1UV-12]MDP1026307.1 helix-turn-helix domain-containing protein [Sphingomonas sp. KR1UV-12]